MDTTIEDANSATSSSAQTDATAESSTATAKTDASPASGAKEPSSISEALAKVKLEEPAEETAKAGNDSQEQQPEESPTPETEAGETADGKTATKDGQAAKPAQSDAGSDAPFHTRPEWQKAEAYFKSDPKAAAALKPILRQAFESETRANEAVKKLTPDAQAADELRRITGGDQAFQTMRNLVRGFGAGDPAVLPILKQMVAQIEQVTGEVIHSPDLVQRQQAAKAQFDQGNIDQAEYDAQVKMLKEAEKGRAGQKRAETQLKSSQEQAQRQQQQAQFNAQTEAINSWEGNIRQRDPDFGDVTDVNDPKHGESIADQVFDAMSLKVMSKPDATTEEMLAAAQRAYDLAKRRVPAPVQRQQRAVTTERSSTTGRQRPRTMREAMDSVKLE